MRLSYFHFFQGCVFSTFSTLSFLRSCVGVGGSTSLFSLTLTELCIFPRKGRKKNTVEIAQCGNTTEATTLLQQFILKKSKSKFYSLNVGQVFFFKVGLGSSYYLFRSVLCLFSCSFAWRFIRRRGGQNTCWHVFCWPPSFH